MTSPDQRTHFMGGLALAILVLASTWTALGNQWVQDDIFIIFSNEAVHSLAAPWRFFISAYWPEPFPPDLYRPFTIVLFATQWAVGEGAPWVFRTTSILLYLGTTLACWALARRLLSPNAAWCAAALFAVHPVHVEAVAVAVNQAELVVALVLMMAVTLWIDRRRSGLLADGLWGIVLLLVWFAAILVKEHAVVLPALLIAAELTVLRRTGIARLTTAAWTRLVIASTLAVAIVLTIRAAVLPDAKGSFTAEGLQGLGLSERALTMLGVVPEWFRLLAWPRWLQADYSPQEIAGTAEFGAQQLLGVMLLVLAIMLILTTWQKRPTIAWGVLWLGISLGPVHNVLVPTGIVLAERTLFLGSAGFLIGSVALLDVALQRSRSRDIELLATGAVGVLLLCGIARSASRQRVWQDIPTFASQLYIDAPLSYRAQYTYAQLMYKTDAKGKAEEHYRNAIALFPNSWVVRVELGDHYRKGGYCWPAIEQYQEVLRLNPYHTAARGSLVACLLYVGQYQEAANVARDGLPFGREVANFTRYASIADSASLVAAPAGTVQLPPPNIAKGPPH